MTDPSVTAFSETAALWHLLEGRTAEVDRIINNLLPGERAELADQLTTLRNMLGAPCPRCGQLTPQRQMVLLHPMNPERREELCTSCAADGT